MKKELLLAVGLTEAQVEAVMKLHKETIADQYIPKHRFDEVNGELKTTKEQLSDRDSQIAGLKKFEGDAQALNDKLKELEEANKQKDLEHQTALAKERKRNAVKLALLEDEAGKPHDADMVMGLFNMDNIVIDEVTGKITAGYKEQNDTLRKEKAFLFNTAGTNNPGINIKGKTPGDGDKGPGVNTAESYGQSLAQIKLGMMGVEPTNTAQ